MMIFNVKSICPILLVLFISSCGGIGVDGANRSETAPQPSSSTSSSSTSSSSGVLEAVPGKSSTSSSSSSTSTSSSSSGSSSSLGVIAHNTPSKVSFIFPQSDASVVNSNLTIRGRAMDADGIRAIRVNGVAATLSALNEGLDTLSSGSPKSSSKESIEQSEGIAPPLGEVDWQANINVPIGNTRVEVEVEDSYGIKIIDQVNTLTLKNSPALRFPSELLKDTAHHRWVGVGDFNTNSLAVDMNTKEVSPLVALSNAMNVRSLETHSPETIALDREGENIYASSITQGAPSKLSFYKTNIATAEVETVAEYTLGLGSYRAVSATANHTANVYYLLAGHIRQDGSTGGQIFGLNIATGQVASLCENITNSNLLASAREIKYANGNLYVLTSSVVSEIIKIPLDCGTVSSLAQLNDYIMTFAVDESANFTYAVGFNRVAKIDLNNLNSDDAISEFDISRVGFGQPSSANMDEERGNLLISDWYMADTIALNTVTGALAQFIPTGRGVGKKLLSPTALVVSQDNKTAYVVETSAGFPSELFQIDLGTGNRKTLSVFERNFQSLWTLGFSALDEKNHRLYLNAAKNIASIDTISGTYSLMADTTVEGLEIGEAGGLIFDSLTNALLIPSVNSQILFELDIKKDELKVVKDLSVTAGQDITGLAGIVKGQTNDLLFAASLTKGEIYSVDMLSGQKELLLDSCVDSFGRNVMSPDYSNLRSVDFNVESQNLLLAGGSYSYLFNVKSGACETFYGFALDLKFLSASSALEASQNEIRQRDLKTGEYVILSR